MTLTVTLTVTPTPILTNQSPPAILIPRLSQAIDVSTLPSFTTLFVP